MTLESISEMRLPLLTHVRVEGAEIAKQAAERTKKGNADVRVDNRVSSLALKLSGGVSALEEEEYSFKEFEKER